MLWLVLRRRWKENARFRIALLLSLGLHTVAALLFPTLATSPKPSAQTLTTISYQRAVRIALQSRPAPAQRPPTVRARELTVPRVVVRHAAAPTHKAPSTKPRPHAIVKPTPGMTKTTRAFALGTPTASPVPQSPAPVAHAKRPAPSTAAPSAAPASSSKERHEVPNAQGSGTRSGIGMFGEVQDPALAKPVMDQLLRRFKVNVTLVVTVGDDGKTKQIEFRPPVTAAVENQIRTLLADANWDPALCGGGIACEGKATIKLSE